MVQKGMKCSNCIHMHKINDKIHNEKNWILCRMQEGKGYCYSIKKKDICKDLKFMYDKINTKEIIFRGKTKDKDKWVEGSLITFIDGTCYIAYPTPDNSSEFLIKSEVFSETVSQYTKINDVNGNKIFEGDILEVISGDLCITKFYVKDVAIPFVYDFLDSSDKLKIIGNIYDNPKLLE